MFYMTEIMFFYHRIIYFYGCQTGMPCRAHIDLINITQFRRALDLDDFFENKFYSTNLIFYIIQKSRKV